ncbi:hypothetical protein BDZ45DRAFT_415253 [Acephala macrosclerotiorum]|nr:hypothetical protein BDZ45DRAFT_415253 [Acephala macrosclerotiorum]
MTQNESTACSDKWLRLFDRAIFKTMSLKESPSPKYLTLLEDIEFGQAILAFFSKVSRKAPCRSEFEMLLRSEARLPSYLMISPSLWTMIVSNARENRTAPHLSSTESLDVQQNQEEQRGRDGSDSEEELSEIREIFDSVGDTVKNFLRLSIIIRNSTNRDRYSRAASAAMTSPYNEQFDIDHVRHKFPELEKSNKVWLIQRLGRSITQRRHYLRCCGEHHAKIVRVPSPMVTPQEKKRSY